MADIILTSERKIKKKNDFSKNSLDKFILKIVFPVLKLSFFIFKWNTMDL